MKLDFEKLAFTVVGVKGIEDNKSDKLIGAKFWITGFDTKVMKELKTRTDISNAPDTPDDWYDFFVTINLISDTVDAYVSYGLPMNAMHPVRLELREENSLKEILLKHLRHSSSPSKTVACANCGKLFIAKGKNIKYCDACHEKGAMGKIKYNVRAKDEAQKLIMNIRGVIYHSHGNDSEVKKDFDYRNNYFKAKLKGVLPPERIDEELEKIPMNNRKDYINWLKKIHKSVKVKGGKR